jgi:hypothetical protein
MTGAEFYLQLQQKYDKAYSQYLDTTKANRLIKEGMYRLVDKICSVMDTQKEYDELSEMIKYNISVAVATGTATQPADYLHLLSMAFKYVDQISFTSISNNIISASAHGLRPGDQISVNADGSGSLKTVTHVTGSSVTVDSAFSPTPANIYLVRTFQASPSTSDKKKPSLSKAVKESPRYWTGVSGTTKVFHLSPAPYSVLMDYVSVPPVNIDVSNSVISLLDTYTQKFLYRLMDECVYSVASETRDFTNKQSAQQTIIENP